MNYAVAKALYRNSMLACLYTDIIGDKNCVRIISTGLEFIGSNFAKKLNLRKSGIPNEKIRHYPTMALQYFLIHRKSIDFESEVSSFLWAERKFAEKIGKINFSENSNCIYVFNTGALSIIKNNTDKRIVLEQCSLPILNYLKKIKEEQFNYPEWVKSKSYDLLQSPIVLKYAEQELEELKLADCVISPSQVVLDAITSEKILVKASRLIPYGYTFGKELKSRSIQKKLRIATIGSLDVRKGIHHFYNVAISGVVAEFVAIGERGKSLSDYSYNLLQKNIILTGHLNRIRLLDEFSKIDILLFLTIGEGSATVVYEALSLGKPVITTIAAGSIVEDGVSGFIVKPDDISRIKECIALLSDPAIYFQMSNAALVRSHFGSNVEYSNRLIDNLKSL